MHFQLVPVAASYHHDNPIPLLAVWIFVIVLIACIGMLSQHPPEYPNQVFGANNSTHKVQYITIGGGQTQTKTESS